MPPRTAREISAEWADAKELAHSMPAPESRRIGIQKVRRSDDGAAVGKGEIVALTLRLHDKELEFRTLAVVTATPLSGDLEVELLPEEEHVAELLASYMRGEGIPYAHRYGRRARLRLRIEFTVAGGPARPAVTRDLGEGGAWILIDDPPALGVEVALKIFSPDSRPELPLDARVVATSNTRPEAGMGVEFQFKDRAAAREFQRWFGEILRAYAPT